MNDLGKIKTSVVDAQILSEKERSVQEMTVDEEQNQPRDAASYMFSIYKLVRISVVLPLTSDSSYPFTWTTSGLDQVPPVS